MKRQPYIPSLIRLGEIVSLDTVLKSSDDGGSNGAGGLGQFLAAPEPTEDPNDLLGSDLFALIKPGNERVIVVLAADGYSQESVSAIMGIPEQVIRSTMLELRARLKDRVSGLR